MIRPIFFKAINNEGNAHCNQLLFYRHDNRRIIIKPCKKREKRNSEIYTVMKRLSKVSKKFVNPTCCGPSSHSHYPPPPCIQSKAMLSNKHAKLSTYFALWRLIPLPSRLTSSIKLYLLISSSSLPFSPRIPTHSPSFLMVFFHNHTPILAIPPLNIPTHPPWHITEHLSHPHNHHCFQSTYPYVL